MLGVVPLYSLNVKKPTSRKIIIMKIKGAFTLDILVKKSRAFEITYLTADKSQLTKIC